MPSWIKFQHFFNADRAAALFTEKALTGGAVSTTYGRRGDYGCRLFNQGNYLRHFLDAGLTHPVVGFAFKFTVDSEGYRFFSIKEGTTFHVVLERVGDGSIKIWNAAVGGTLIGQTVAGLVPLNVDLFFVLDVTIGNSAPIELWIDGTSRYSNATADSQNGGTGILDAPTWGHGTGISFDPEYRVMDIYVADGDDADYHIMHDWRGERLAPTSDVSVDFIRSTGGTNFGTVDEVPFSSSDKNTSAVSGDVDQYGHAAGALAYDIISIAVIAQLAKDSGSASAKIGLVSGGNLEQGSSIVLSTTAAVAQFIITEEPTSGDPLDSTIRDAINSHVENVT